MPVIVDHSGRHTRRLHESPSCDSRPCGERPCGERPCGERPCESRIPRRWSQGVACLLTLVALLLGGCQQYPAASSPEALHVLAALRTACSSQNVERLGRVRVRLDELQDEGTLSRPELEAFGRILALADKREWEKAEQACYQFQKAQLRGG